MHDEDVLKLGGATPRCGAGGVAIYQTATFAHQSAEQMRDVFEERTPGHVYTRNSNPTTHALELALTDLEGGVGCIATASGMAALATTFLGLLRPGDHVVSATGIFGGTVSLLRDVLGRFGVGATFVDAADLGQVSGAMQPRTRIVFAETIGNPRMDVPDLAGLAHLAHDAGAILVVDSTVTTPALIRPGEFGADVVIHSTTKFINGHGTALGGAIIDTGRRDWMEGPFEDVAALASTAGPQALLAHLRQYAYRDLGGCPAPGSSHLMLQGLATLRVRMREHCEHARNLAEALVEHPRVRWLKYPGSSNSEFRSLVDRQFGGQGGGLITLGLETRARAFRFLNSLQQATLAANLGETRTLVVHPASTIFHDIDAHERAAMGVTDDMVRVAVGLEPWKETLADFLQALDHCDA